MTSNPDSNAASRKPEASRRLGPLDVLVVSAWCGLAAGELEVAIRILTRNLSSSDRLYLMTRHFVWVIPLISLFLFLSMGVILALATKVWPRRAGWLSPRLTGTATILPALLASGRGIYTEAWLIFAIGFAFWLTPWLERHAAGLRRRLLLSFPLLMGMVLVQAGLIFGTDRFKQWREEGRALPAPESPNVLLIVLDTVRADHLSLYGYERTTTPNLERLAKRGIRFDQARAAAPWTLASHASLFTGRWPHELSVKWMFPLRGEFSTLAEYLGSLGYATAGFVGNRIYCAYDSGLDRGFTHYEDYDLDTLSAFRTARLIDLSLKMLVQFGPALGQVLPIGPSLPRQGLDLLQLSVGQRKDAQVINHEFLNWLSRRREPRRPFFAFLNYVDTHAPYVLRPGAEHRFGSAPATEADLLFLVDGWLRIDRLRLPPQLRALGRDSYDNCLAYLDEWLGHLFDELQHRGVLDQTVIIITADHGEGLGEHDLFDHGESLYRTEIRVPLVIVLPPGSRSQKIISEPVSLRDIPVTIADLISPGTKPPFPGRPLTRFWCQTPSDSADPDPAGPVLSELAAPNPADPNHGRSPARRGRLVALAEGDFVYIRNEGDGGEELFNQRDDPREILNRIGAKALRPVVQQFRDRLDRMKASPPDIAR